MMFVSHLLFGMLAGILGCSFLRCDNVVVFASVSAFASMIPDLDHLNSKISRKLQPFAVILSLFRHRGFVHSVFPPIMLYFLLLSFDFYIAAAVFIGYLSHLLLDSLTVKGVRLLYPVVPFRISGFIKTNSFSEKILAVMLLVLLIMYLADIFANLFP